MLRCGDGDEHQKALGLGCCGMVRQKVGMRHDTPATTSKAPNAAITMADVSARPRINEPGIALRNVLIAILKHSHQTAEPTNTPMTIVATVDHLAPPCDPAVGPSPANIARNDRTVMGLDSVRTNVVRKYRIIVLGAPW